MPRYRVQGHVELCSCDALESRQCSCPSLCWTLNKCSMQRCVYMSTMLQPRVHFGWKYQIPTSKHHTLHICMQHGYGSQAPASSNRFTAGIRGMTRWQRLRERLTGILGEHEAKATRSLFRLSFISISENTSVRFQHLVEAIHLGGCPPGN
jgi:hypothetical protein